METRSVSVPDVNKSKKSIFKINIIVKGVWIITIKQIYEHLNDITIRDEFVKQVEKLYGNINNNEIKLMLSLKNNFYNLGDKLFRKLDDDEILDPVKYLGVNMLQIHLVPLFDISDNDFITYDVQNNEFALFNIQEEIVFSRTNKFLDYLNK